MTVQRPLSKADTDRKLCGVAGGIAHHYGVDPTLVRLGFVLAAFCWGLGIVLYLVACVVMPPAADGTPNNERRQTVSNNPPEAGSST